MYKQQSLNIADWFMLADIELENSAGVLVLNANYFLQLRSKNFYWPVPHP